MRVDVKLFGSVREEVGAKELCEELPEGSRVADLRARLEARHPGFGRLGDRLAASVNAELVQGDRTLRDGDVVAFLPPVAGGAGRSIRFLEYEAYPEMAEREMQKIADEAAERWPGARVAMAHRTGHLEVGEAAVVVVAAAPHRAEAFEACRYAIDTLKTRVPIWKKEVAQDGEYWVDDHA